MASEGDLLWTPSEEARERSELARFMRWLEEERALSFSSYEELQRWSVSDLEPFWAAIWDYFELIARAPYERVLARREMPGAEWFPGARLNYAEHALRGSGDLAVIARSEAAPERRLDKEELRALVARAAAGLRRLGVEKGDRVAAFLPNGVEALVAFLAAASVGAIWSSCAPEFGAGAVIDRFRQIEPKVLFAVEGYRYAGRDFDRRGVLSKICAALDTVSATVLVGAERATGRGEVAWRELLAEPAELRFEPLPFDHPLWVLYSSGTTGLPKAIVQGHGGILIEHHKALALHCDLGPDDRFFWYTTTGWMMWNYLVGGLLVGSAIVLYDGSPGHPDLEALWRMADELELTYFGTSAPFLLACRKQGIEPGRGLALERLRAVGSTGSPLPPEGFEWVYERVKRDLLLGSVSGGTDVCTPFVISCPLLPVRAGEIQCSALGADVRAFDAAGRAVVDEVGELVLTEPLPSMPLRFWNDPEGARLRESYFNRYPGVWRHGDWVKITERGSCVVYGRSDATLNRGGTRMGTSDFYRVVESFPQIADALVVEAAAGPTEEGQLWLFVVLGEGAELETLSSELRAALRRSLSPRHAPDEIVAVPAVPYTLSGKKLEVPVRRILAGEQPERCVNPETLANPEAIGTFVELAEKLRNQ